MDSSPPADADSVAGCGGNTGSYYCAQKYALIKLLQQKDPTHRQLLHRGLRRRRHDDVRQREQQGWLHPVRGAEDDRRQPGGPDQTPEGPGHHQRQGQQHAGLWLDDVGGVQILRRRQWYARGRRPPGDRSRPTVSDTGTDTRDYPANSTTGSAYWANGNTALTPYAYTSSSTALPAPAASNMFRRRPPANAAGITSSTLDTAIRRATTTMRMRRHSSSVSAGRPHGSVPARAASGDEGARYLFNSDVDPNTAGTQNVITYTIGTYQPPATGQIAGMITTMKSMARQGGGSYYDATNIQKLSDAFAFDLHRDPGQSTACSFRRRCRSA